jgi:hypothetical protein
MDELDLAVLVRAAQQCRHHPHLTTAQAIADGFMFGTMSIPPGGDIPAWFHTSLSRLVVAGFMRSTGKRRALPRSGPATETPMLEITPAGRLHLTANGVTDA